MLIRLRFLVGALACAIPAHAAEVKTIGVVCHCGADFPTYKSFEAGLSERGLRDGDNVRVLRRFSNGDPARLARDAEEIVALKPDVIFAGFTPAVVAVQKHTATIPVVFAGVSDASEIGAASHNNRPEHNFTGPLTINRELMPKRLELIKEALPAIKIVGYLANPGYALHEPQLQEMEQAAQRLGIRLLLAQARAAADLEGAVVDLKARGAQALIVQQDPLFTGQSAKVIALAETSRLPAIYALRGFYDLGGLMWYGADLRSLFHRAADYIDKVLKGAKTGDLPVERPGKLSLTINLQAAKRIGIEISPSILARADEVIE